MVDWGVYDKFEDINDVYLPMRGEGETKATQIVTAVNKLVYKFYNDGDVYDNTYYMKGWCNDLSSFANWLYKYVGKDHHVKYILASISDCKNDDDYSELLYDLAISTLDEDFLSKMNEIPKEGSVYDCDGPFVFDENSYDESDSWDDEDEDF